ncbi:MAG TPA: hypothetical protein VN894_14050 [Polyangiaceae bacterium]|nr:hypothetical protein [Polyangiaceae bacterium]
MPTATTTPSKTEPPNDAPPPTVAARQDLAGGKQSEPQPADASDDRYDNVACTD